MVSSSRDEAGLGIDAAFLVRRQHLWAFSLSIALSGLYLARWDASDATLSSVAYLLLASAFYSMSVCTSDLLAAIPFSGGAFGLARVAVSFYGGFLVAVAECFEYILCTADAVQSLGATLALVWPDLAPFQPITYLVLYALLTHVHLAGGPSVWKSYNVLATTTILGLVVYLGSSVPRLELRPLRTKSMWSSGLELAALLPSQMRLFMGLECLNLCGQDVDDPQISLPFVQRQAMRIAIASSFILGVITVGFAPLSWTAPSVYPPLAPGLADSWSVSMQVASLLSLPSMLASAFCFMHGYSRVLSYMASSRLVHRSLRRRVGRHRTPRRALYVGSALSFAACLASHYAPVICLQSCAAACASIMYMAQCYGYMYFTTSVQRQASAGARRAVARRRVAAGFAASVFLASLIACCATGFPLAPASSNVAVVGVIASVTLGSSVYYVSVVKHSQLFSEHERRSLMVAHIVVFNKNKRRQSSQRLKKIIASQKAAMYIKRALTTPDLLQRKTASDIPRNDTPSVTRDVEPELPRTAAEFAPPDALDSKADEGSKRTLSLHKVKPTLTRHGTVPNISHDRRTSFSIQADRRPSISIKPNLSDRRPSIAPKPSLNDRRVSVSMQGAGREHRPGISIDCRPSITGNGRRSSAVGRHGALRSMLGKQHLGSVHVMDLAVLFQNDAEDLEDENADGCMPFSP
ncbi:hypothetical protein SPRG_12909 [Saprolegnia parasitica CBS 223.65]|uniref:Amino acid permease/ SLC12A domain-containing protein n=1 Tax=Saprolegnia parasitica (strain CBS 223.65) TaxID=695850 RepID=A0A067BS96_SAPPC|nr:hypothetical protein SPRG_12909 [Saprolegnia parasitica CBS 223.65]KDO21128.1 hypothetical protein SPRG_12909 [Saprolegnia parasitica CBS 223.65]|eukprot:XP_012208129.1 hypothetical protein SPRG_12909 [Saprolegnia parasitica CBS 223.65]